MNRVLTSFAILAQLTWSSSSLGDNIASTTNDGSQVRQIVDVPYGNWASFTGKCPANMYVTGIVVERAGTCHNQCDGDAPAVRTISLICEHLTVRASSPSDRSLSQVKSRR